MKRIAVALLILVGLPLQIAWASPIVIGSGSSLNGFPFGEVSGPIAYLGEYQQIYLSTAFSGPLFINQIAFESAALGTLSDTFALGLGTTSATPSDPGTTYLGNKRPDFTQVFSGTVVTTLMGGSAFDLLINLDSPFLYDPSAGNLLLDVFLTAASGNSAPFKAGISTDVGRLSNFGGTGAPTATPNFGLLTQFDVTQIPIPEPMTLMLVGIGLARGVMIRNRSKRSSGQAVSQVGRLPWCSGTRSTSEPAHRTFAAHRQVR